MAVYILRSLEQGVKESLEDYPVVALLGPRQAGKSTLVKKLRENKLYLDLELNSDFTKLEEPELFFEQNHKALICLDEIRLIPEIFKTLRGVVDKRDRNKQFLVLGSASRDLIRQSSESLAGRVCYLELSPFHMEELDKKDPIELWLRGGFPRSFLSKSHEKSFQWRENYIRTYLERDIPQLGFNIPAKSIERLWRMLAHLQGQNLNSSKLAASLGVSSHTVKSYVDILEQTFLLRTLKVFETNMKKQQIKSPKIYIRDSGLLHTLLNLETMNDMIGHPIFGSSFEGFVIENIISGFPKWKFNYYRTKSGAEVDLVMSKGNRVVAIEIKASKAPKVERGFWSAVEDIKASEKFVIALVDETYEIQNKTIVTNLRAFLKDFS